MSRLSFWAPALAVFSTPMPSLAQVAGPYFYGQHMWDSGWHSWFFGPLMMILFLAVAVLLIVLLVRWVAPPSHTAPHHTPIRTPLDILKERFARGEIDKDEFEERRRILGD